MLLLFLSALKTNADNGQCIWYGECYKNEDDQIFNCDYNGPGKPIPDKKSQEIMFERCPDVYKNGKPTANINQKITIKHSVSILIFTLITFIVMLSHFINRNGFDVL